MVVEFLTFAVDPADLADWLAVEHGVWTAFLETVPGFVRKEMWQEPGDPATVHAVIWWENRDAWDAIGPEQVAAVDDRMGEWYRTPTMRQFTVVG